MIYKIRSRRYNLKIYGLAEQKDEKDESLEAAVNDIGDVVELEPVMELIHRLVEVAPEKIRRVTFFNIHDFRNQAHRLKRRAELEGTVISNSEDFPPKIRDLRNQLYDRKKQNELSYKKNIIVF